MQPLSGVVFDLDGLLVDSEPLQVRAWAAILARRGQALQPAVVADLFGRSVRDAAHLVRERYALADDVEVLVAEREASFTALAPSLLVVMPGAHTLLAALRARGIRVALATSGQRPLVERILAALHLDAAFDATVTSDDVARTKPAPDLYRVAAARLGLATGECLALDDAPNGIAAARAAGLRCLAIPHRLTAGLPGLEAADAILPSLEVVLPWLEEHHLLGTD